MLDFPEKAVTKVCSSSSTLLAYTKGCVGVNFSEKCFGAIQVLRNAFP